MKSVIDKIFTLGIYLISLLSILALSGYGVTQINMGSGLLFILVCLNGMYYKKHADKRLCVPCNVAAFIGTFSLSVGNIIRDMDESGLGRHLRLTDIIYAVGIYIFLYMFMQNAFYLLSQVKMQEKCFYHLSGKQCMLLTLLLVVMWLPYYLTFFPGIFGSDPLESIRMGTAGNPWTNHHPVLYTFYIKLFIALFSKFIGMNGAMGIMILAQQLILAGSFVYCISFMWKRGISKWVLAAVFLFVTVNPVIGVFSVYATKDVLFSAAVLIYIVKLFALQEHMNTENGRLRNELLQLLCNGLLVMFLRNNGSFVVVGTLCYLFWKYRKIRKQIMLVLLLSISCMMLQKGVLFSILQIQEGSFAESLSIPLQQVAQTVVDDGKMTPQEQEYLNELLPLDRIREVYQAGYTDRIKFDEQFNDELLNQDKMKFLKVWFGMLPDNFDSYVKAYLLQTAGYWDISQTDSLTTYGVIANESGLEQIDVFKKLCGHSLQPVIEKMILVCRKLPILCYLTNMALMLFSSFLAAYLLHQKKVADSFMLPLWIGWGTIMIAAPASCKFRYMLPLYMTLPFILWITTRYGLNHVDEE